MDSKLPGGQATRPRRTLGRVSPGTDAANDAAIRLLDLRETPLDAAEVLAAVADPAAGGVNLFVGAVRDHDGGQSVDLPRLLRPPLRASTGCARSRAVSSRSSR